MTWSFSSHLTIYCETGWYAAHPCVLRAPSGDLIVAFHRYPDLRCSHHSHPLFHVCATRSTDEGKTWSTPEPILHNPRGGIGDFGIHALPDGHLLLHGGSFELVPEEATDSDHLWRGDPEHGDVLPQTENERRSDYNRWKTLMGPPIYAHSADNGRTWSGLRNLPPIPDAVYGHPASHCGGCRSGVVVLDDGTLLMPSKATEQPDGGNPYFGLIRISRDMGRTWTFGGRIAQDPSIHFSEPTIHQTPSGRILVLFRCHLPAEHAARVINPGFPDQARQPQLGLVVSDDQGKTWSDVKITSIQGSPAHLLGLRDGRIFLTCGMRWSGHKGCCARVLEPEANDLETAHEFTVRGDSFGFADCGYPWSVELEDGRVLVVHYRVDENRLRGITGTILKETH